jgi:hypothetical protein
MAGLAVTVYRTRLKLVRFDFLQLPCRPGVPTCHSPFQRWPQAPPPRRLALSLRFGGLLARVVGQVLQFNSRVASSSIELRPTLTLHQAKFQDWRGSAGEQCQSVLPDVVQKTRLSLHVPAGNIRVGTIRTEQLSKPLVQCNMNTAGALGEG